MVDPVEQKIKQNTLFNEDLILEPETVRELYTDNYYRRNLSLLEGWTGYRTKLLKVTSDGVLKVAMTGAGLTDYNTETGTALDDYDTTTTFRYEEAYSRWDILIEDNDAIVSFRNQFDTGWLDDIILTTGYHSLDFSSKGIRIKNRNAGSNAKFQIVAYR